MAGCLQNLLLSHWSTAAPTQSRHFHRVHFSVVRVSPVLYIIITDKIWRNSMFFVKKIIFKWFCINYWFLWLQWSYCHCRFLQNHLQSLHHLSSSHLQEYQKHVVTEVISAVFLRNYYLCDNFRKDFWNFGTNVSLNRQGKWQVKLVSLFFVIENFIYVVGFYLRLISFQNLFA